MYKLLILLVLTISGCATLNLKEMPKPTETLYFSTEPDHDKWNVLDSLSATIEITEYSSPQEPITFKIQSNPYSLFLDEYNYLYYITISPKHKKAITVQLSQNYWAIFSLKWKIKNKRIVLFITEEDITYRVQK